MRIWNKNSRIFNKSFKRLFEIQEYKYIWEYLLTFWEHELKNEIKVCDGKKNEYAEQTLCACVYACMLMR